MTAGDALEFLIAGASAVQVGTANLVNPKACLDILDGIDRYLDENNFSSVTEIIGSLNA